MSFEEDRRQLSILHARMQRMEAMMQQLLGVLTGGGAEIDRHRHMQAMLQELSGGSNPYPTDMASPYPSAMAPAASAQESPQLQAIRAAWIAGDKIKAIKLYRELYGVDMKTAQDALSRM